MFDSVVEALCKEISIKYQVLCRRIELFSIPDQLSSEGLWEYYRRVTSRCKEEAIGSRTTGLELNYDQFVVTLFLNGLKESTMTRPSSKLRSWRSPSNRTRFH